MIGVKGQSCSVVSPRQTKTDNVDAALGWNEAEAVSRPHVVSVKVERPATQNTATLLFVVAGTTPLPHIPGHVCQSGVFPVPIPETALPRSLRSAWFHHCCQIPSTHSEPHGNLWPSAPRAAASPLLFRWQESASPACERFRFVVGHANDRVGWPSSADHHARSAVSVTPLFSFHPQPCFDQYSRWR